MAHARGFSPRCSIERINDPAPAGLYFSPCTSTSSNMPVSSNEPMPSVPWLKSDHGLHRRMSHVVEEDLDQAILDLTNDPDVMPVVGPGVPVVRDSAIETRGLPSTMKMLLACSSPACQGERNRNGWRS